MENYSLGNVISVVYQAKYSDTKKPPESIIPCILKKCGYRHGSPCMKCVVYGFLTSSESKYADEGDGLCRRSLYEVIPTIENYEYILYKLRHAGYDEYYEDE